MIRNAKIARFHVNHFKTHFFRKTCKIGYGQKPDDGANQIFIRRTLAAKKCTDNRDKKRSEFLVKKRIEKILRRKKFKHHQVSTRSEDSKRFFQTVFRIRQVSHPKSVQNHIKGRVTKRHLHRIELHRLRRGFLVPGIRKHPKGKIPENRRPRLSDDFFKSRCKVPRAAAKIEKPHPRMQSLQFPAAGPAPTDIPKAAERVIEKIVAFRNIVKHFTDGRKHGPEFKKLGGGCPTNPIQKHPRRLCGRGFLVQFFSLYSSYFFSRSRRRISVASGKNSGRAKPIVIPKTSPNFEMPSLSITRETSSPFTFFLWESS